MKTAARIVVSVAVLALLFLRFGVSDVVQLCLRADPVDFLAAFAIYMLSQVLSAVRWLALARGVGFRVGFSRTTRWYLIGMFFGLVVPSTIGSDAARALYLGQSSPGRAQALSTVIFDRLIGLIVLVAIAIVALLLGPRTALPDGLEASIVAIGALLVGGWMLLPAAVRWLRPGQRWRRLVEEDLTPYFRDPRLLGGVALLSLVVHGLQIVAQRYLTRAIGLKVALGFVAIYHPLVSLAAAVPLTIGGFGLREAAYAYLLPYEGIGADDAIALGLMWWAVGALGALVGGAVYWLPGTETISLRRAAHPPQGRPSGEEAAARRTRRQG